MAHQDKACTREYWGQAM